MSTQQEKNQVRLQELETAKSKLETLIKKLRENPSLTDEEISEVEGGSLQDTGSNWQGVGCNCKADPEQVS